jgi:hypothetical protein
MIIQPKTKVRPCRDWAKYAHALDMRLEGKLYPEIAKELGVSKQWAFQMVKKAKAQLAFRIFHVPRPQFSRRDR